VQQAYQEVRGTMSAEGEEWAISNASLLGDQLRFTVTTVIQAELVKMAFDGRVTGHAIGGSVEVRGGPMAGRYDWTAQREAAGTDNTPPR
jgi:hypothetical protein